MSICNAVMPSVRQDGDFVPFVDQTHGDARDRCLDRHAGIHEGQGAAAHRGHRRRTVRLEDLGDEANRVREFFLAGQHLQQRPFGEGAVADLAASRASQEPRLADTEGREVVVQHELLVVLADERVDLLLIRRRAQRGDDERLRLAAREQRRAVGARQHADFTGDLADVGGAAAVDTVAVVDDVAAHDLALHLFDHGLQGPGLIRQFVEQWRQHVLCGLASGGGTLVLALDAQGLAQARRRRVTHTFEERLVKTRRGERALRFADRLLQLVLHVEQRLQSLVCGEQCLEHHVLGKHAGASLDHDEPGAAAGNQQVQIGLFELAVPRVDDELAVDAADAHRGDGPVERDVGQLQGGRGSRHGDDVGVVLLVVGEHGGDHLRFRAEAVWKQRPDRPVNQARGEHLFLRRPSFALEKPAGDLAGGKGAFLVVAGEREKIDPLALAARRHCGD
jgi:hypothetical protein